MPFHVTVIMTVKNGRRFIDKSLHSIFDQTFLPYEIVIVDDGSVDDTKQVVNVIAKDSAIPIHFIETGGIGRARALNLAVRKSSCEWIANLDVDDYWLPEKLWSQIELLKMEPKAKIITTKTRVIVQGASNDFQPTEKQKFGYRVLSKKAFYSRNPVNHSSVLYSKSVFYDAGQYNEKLSKQIDYDLWIRFLISGFCFYQVNQQSSVKVLHKAQSFEAKSIVKYRLQSIKMNYWGLWKLKASSVYYILPPFYFLIGFLPRGIKTQFSQRLVESS